MKKRQKLLATDLMIIIRYAKINVSVDNDVFDESDISKIKYAVAKFSREIIIDKTYVAYKDTKYHKHFLTEDGWNRFCKLLKDTKYGKKTTSELHAIILESYYLMILSYLYLCLSDIGYESDGIYLEIPEKSLYMVEITTDTYQEYKRYPGKWQTW